MKGAWWAATKFTEEEEAARRTTTPVCFFSAARKKQKAKKKKKKTEGAGAPAPPPREEHSTIPLPWRVVMRASHHGHFSDGGQRGPRTRQRLARQCLRQRLAQRSRARLAAAVGCGGGSQENASACLRAYPSVCGNATVDVSLLETPLSSFFFLT